MKKRLLAVVVISLVIVGCDESSDGAEDTSCTVLFGAPAENTGLDEGMCQPSCDCTDLVFTPPNYTEEEIAALASRELRNPPTELLSDPYATPELHVSSPDKHCALLVDPQDPNAYQLETYDSLEAVETAGATITHHGACGRCSSLNDLAVYIRITDLTGPVRSCSLQGMSGTPEDTIACLQALGFTLPCAQAWYFNSANTRALCLPECMAALTAKYHQEDGSPNDCIQCDEEKSGPVFKAVSGRTRRNSGLPSGLCRPCSTIAPVVHRYP